MIKNGWILSIILIHSTIFSMNPNLNGAQREEVSNDRKSHPVHTSSNYESEEKRIIRLKKEIAVPQELYKDILHCKGARFCSNQNYIAILQEEDTTFLRLLVADQQKNIKFSFRLHLSSGSTETPILHYSIEQTTFSPKRRLCAYLKAIDKTIRHADNGVHYKTVFIGYDLVIEDIQKNIKTFPIPAIQKVDLINFHEQDSQVIVFGDDHHNNKVRHIIDIPLSDKELLQNKFVQFLRLIAVARKNYL